MAAALLGIGASSPEIDAAFSGTRTISLYHIHTKETLTVTYKKDGKYEADALEKINWLMRDWRENKQVEIDPAVIDLLWEMHTELGSKEPIHIICGHRSHKTNNMLRRTRGGQAKRSYHLTGKAIDAAFPDVPVKRMRYSALIRERGGVGYYPTSGIPFVHVDSGPVRAWPRLPRYELALLFPNGKTAHRPSNGGPITQKDVRVARSRHNELAAQVAAYFDVRSQPKTPTLLAEAPRPAIQVPKPEPANPPKVEVASLSPIAPRPVAAAAPSPARAPRLMEPPKRISPPPPEAERMRLNELVTQASLTSWDTSVRRPPEADRRKLNELFITASIDSSAPAAQPRVAKLPAAANVAGAAAPRTSARTGSRQRVPQAMEDIERTTRVAALESPKPTGARGNLTDVDNSDWNTGWVPAPQFDEDHPEELSYRPFPLAPLLTQSASVDDAAFVGLVHPDVARTLDLLGDEQIVLPMRLRPGRQVAEVMLAQQFRGEAVNLSALEEAERSRAAPTAVTSRTVKTIGR